MSFWGILVIINVLTIFPSPLNYLLVDLIYSSSSLILFRFFILHFSLSFLLLALIFIHVLFLHNISSISPFLNLSSSIFYSFSFLIIKDLFIYFIFYSSYLLLLLLNGSEFLSNPINNILSSSLSTPLHILPESYFLLFYALLRSLPSKLFGLIIILSFLFLLLFSFSFLSHISSFLLYYGRLILFSSFFPLSPLLSMTIDYVLSNFIIFVSLFRISCFSNSIFYDFLSYTFLSIPVLLSHSTSFPHYIFFFTSL